MKHIFKKRPKGTNHEPHHAPSRSNDTSSSTDAVSPSSVSDHTTATSNRNSGHDPVPSSPSTPITAPSNSSNTPELSSVNLQDYLSSEEEYQVQLALALSVSGSGSHNVPERHQLDHTKLPREGDSVRKRDASVADFMSRQYWDYGVLDFEEKVVDGFYIVHGLTTNPMTEGKMPSLADLETNDGDSAFEVVLVDRRVDPSLEELLQIAQCVKLGVADGDVSILVHRLAELVTEQMGGSVKDANIMLARWMERSSELSTSLHTSALPIGSLKIGLSRHRALLFKVLADNVGLPCRLVKGSHYTGIEDDAISVVKLVSGSEFLVDLMGAPGMLIPADILNGKVTSFSSCDVEASKLPIHELPHESAVSFPVLEPLGESEGSSHSFLVKNSSFERKPRYQTAESSPSSLTVRGDTGVGSSQTAKVTYTNQSDYAPLSARDNPVHEVSHGQIAAGDGSRMNFNIVPYAQSSKEDSKNLFADLNPFHIKGTGQSSAQNNSAWGKVDDMQRSKNSSYRPPGPLMWKNRHACNEVPSKKESDFVERVRRSNFGPNDCNLGTLTTTTSTVNGVANFDNQKLQANSSSEYHGENSSLVAGNSLLSPTEQQVDRLSLVKNLENNHKDGVLMVNERAHSGQGKGTNVSRIHDYRKSSPDMTDLKQMGLQNPGSSIYSSSVLDDHMLDDVGECEIRWEDLQIGDRIGLGSYGEVYHADWNGTEVAVKKFLDQDFSGDALAEFRSEVRIMRRFRHPNIVLFMGAVTRPPHLSIVSEFLPRGSLHRIIHRRNCPIDEKRRIRMALDVAKGMNCLHTSVPTIVHRDLKSPNLLVDNDWTVKVCDFGLSRLKHNTFLSSKSTAGTPEWMAPEVLRNEPSNEKCDVYSFGVILWQLATLRLPWVGMNPMQVVGAVGFQNRRLAIPDEVDPVVARIIRECWQTDPNLRPSFAQLAVALKSLQRLVIPSSPSEHQSSYYAQEISMNSTP